MALLILFIFLMILAGIVLAVWAIIDIVGHADADFTAIGQNKYLWVALVAGGTFFGGPIGVVLGIYYLASIRPRLQRTTW